MIVHVVVGLLVLVLGIVRLQRQLQVRPPVANGGGSAISAKPEVWDSIEQAALAAAQADPATRAHLFGPRWRLARRYTRPTFAVGPRHHSNSSNRFREWQCASPL